MIFIILLQPFHFLLPAKLFGQTPVHLTLFWPLLTFHFLRQTFSFLCERTFSHYHYFLFLYPHLFFLMAVIPTWLRHISCLWHAPHLDISSIKTNVCLYDSWLFCCSSEGLAFLEQMSEFLPFLCVQRQCLLKCSLY